MSAILRKNLALSRNSGSSTDKLADPAEFPPGAIAGVVILAVLLLIALLVSVIWTEKGTKTMAITDQVMRRKGIMRKVIYSPPPAIGSLIWLKVLFEMGFGTMVLGRRSRWCQCAKFRSVSSQVHFPSIATKDSKQRSSDERFLVLKQVTIIAGCSFGSVLNLCLASAQLKAHRSDLVLNLMPVPVASHVPVLTWICCSCVRNPVIHYLIIGY